MKTISAHLNINNHGFNQSITTKKSYRNHKIKQNYDQAAGDINRNATISQAEYQRDACEEELYRLRYGIENLLANNEYGDFNRRQPPKFPHVQNPFRTVVNRVTDFNNRMNTSWIEQCSPCCRRGRRDRYDDNANIPNEYTYRQVYNDRNYDSPLRRTPESPLRSQLYSESVVSTSPSPSISPYYINPNMSHTKNDLRQSIDNLINRNTPNKTDISDLLKSKEMNDPVYNSLILKILEAKALDCLCTGYSKQNTQKQISEALSGINQRADEHQWDSDSAASSRSVSDSAASPRSVSDSDEPSLITVPASDESSLRSVPISNESSSTVSSVSTQDESVSSRPTTLQLYSPLASAIRTPNLGQSTSTLTPDNNKDKIKSSLKLNRDIETPKKLSKVTIVTDKTPQSGISKNKKKSFSKHHKKSAKTTKKPSKSHHSSRKPSKSKHSRLTPSKSKHASKTPSRSKHSSRKPSKSKHSSRKPSESKHSSRKPSKSKHSSRKPSKSKHSSRKPSKSKHSSKKRSSSKSGKKKDSSKSPSKSRTSTKPKSKHKKSSKKKRTKHKSNNQVNDHQAVILPTFIYPQSYQDVYRNRQRLLKFLFS